MNMYASWSGDNTSHFTNKPGDIHVWAHPTEAQVSIFPHYNYWNDIVSVSSIDTNNNIVYLNGYTDYYTIRPGDRYYVQNVFEELDAPGEWYLDSTNKYLYFYPPTNISTATPVYAPVVTNIVTFATSVSNIIFQRFTLECCAGTAITLTNTTNCLIAANTIFNVGDYYGSGVTVSGGFTNGVVGNDISYVGRHGIEMSGGNYLTLTPALNYADNNYIHDIGVVYKQGSGIWFTEQDNVGLRASRNLIKNGPRFGIFMQGENLVVVSNIVHNVMLETDDGGMIYVAGLNWLSARGSSICYNYLHDAAGFGFFSGLYETPCMSYGIYLDSLSCGVDVIGNVVARCSGAGLYVDGGSDNRATNNIFVDCDHASSAPLFSQQIYYLVSGIDYTIGQKEGND